MRVFINTLERRMANGNTTARKKSMFFTSPVASDYMQGKTARGLHAMIAPCLLSA